MAKDAFALSPISARAVQPSEEDYEAISEAFMETARGRWFLGEYAKRNRNADTHMVLDAVARIEQSLAAQKQPPADDKLAGALTAIKAALNEARNAASVAIDGLALEPNLAPVHKATRIIKEISWRWREIGADSRICDLIDQQVAAIEASCEQLGAIDPKTVLGAAFDLIDQRLTQLGESQDMPIEAPAAQRPVAEAASTPPASQVVAEVIQAISEQPENVAGEAAAESRIETGQAIAPVETALEAPMPTAEIPETASVEVAATVETAEPIEDAAIEAASESMEMSAEEADAQDEAVLDIIAMEMAVVDPADDEEEENQAVETPPEEMAAAVDDAPLMTIEEPAPVMQEIISAVMEPSSAQSPSLLTRLQSVMETAAEPRSAAQRHHSPEALAEAILQASPEPSLGSMIVASGIIRKPISASDPLASLRRLTQAERIALFS
jgi:hypothetical protein